MIIAALFLISFRYQSTSGSCLKMYHLETPNRRNISKSTALGHKKGVADHCYADKKVKHHLVKKINSMSYRQCVKLDSLKRFYYICKGF